MSWPDPAGPPSLPPRSASRPRRTHRQSFWQLLLGCSHGPLHVRGPVEGQGLRPPLGRAARQRQMLRGGAFDYGLLAGAGLPEAEEAVAVAAPRSWRASELGIRSTAREPIWFCEGRGRPWRRSCGHQSTHGGLGGAPPAQVAPIWLFEGEQARSIYCCCCAPLEQSGEGQVDP